MFFRVDSKESFRIPISKLLAFLLRSTSHKYSVYFYFGIIAGFRFQKEITPVVYSFSNKLFYRSTYLEKIHVSNVVRISNSLIRAFFFTTSTQCVHAMCKVHCVKSVQMQSFFWSVFS